MVFFQLDYFQKSTFLRYQRFHLKKSLRNLFPDQSDLSCILLAFSVEIDLKRLFRSLWYSQFSRIKLAHYLMFVKRLPYLVIIQNPVKDFFVQTESFCLSCYVFSYKRKVPITSALVLCIPVIGVIANTNVIKLVIYFEEMFIMESLLQQDVS